MPTVIDTSQTKLGDERVGVVVSLYNRNITKALEDAAVKTLIEAGIQDSNIVVTHVPGAWELPSGVTFLFQNKRFDAVIALGAVIKGDTTHDQYINQAVSLGLMEMSSEWEVPVGFGLLTCNNLEQALERSGGSVGNKGEEAASTVVEMLKLRKELPIETEEISY